jgi:hypothetical protein
LEQIRRRNFDWLKAKTEIGSRIIHSVSLGDTDR